MKDTIRTGKLGENASVFYKDNFRGLYTSQIDVYKSVSKTTLTLLLEQTVILGGEKRESHEGIQQMSEKFFVDFSTHRRLKGYCPVASIIQ